MKFSTTTLHLGYALLPLRHASIYIHIKHRIPVGYFRHQLTLLLYFVTESAQICVQIGCRQLVLIGSNGSKVSVLGEIMRQGSLVDAPPDFQLISRNKARVISNDATIAEVLFLSF